MEPTQPLIIGLGEILWDMLPAGRKLGGAPSNFAYHAGALGARAAVVSRVGNDALGREILQRLDELKLDRSHVSTDPLHPTGVVDVKVDARGIPEYVIRTGAAWDFLECSDATLALAARANAVCFGSLAQRSTVSREAIRQFIRATRPSCLRVFDINLRQHYFDRQIVHESLQQCDVLKLNDQELPVVSDLLDIRGADASARVAEVIRRYPLRLVALTRGPGGSVLYSRDGQTNEHPGFPGHVDDTVGAGDAFTAALVLGLLDGHPIDRINAFANRLAAFVCSMSGATPAIPQSLRDARVEG